MNLPDVKPPQQLRAVSSHLAGWHQKAPHAGWEDPDGLLGSGKAEIRRLTPDTWCFVYAISGPWEER